MLSSDIKREMMRFVGGGSFITCPQLTKFLGMKDAQTVRKNYLQGLDHIDRSLYFIPDVVENMMARKH